MRKIVITGCSGGGKSTLLAALAAEGHATVTEPGRRVIAAERACGGDGFPWSNPKRFADLAFDMALADYTAANAPLTFFDRSALDQAAWYAREGLHPPAPPPRYDRVVLLAPPWEALYANDADRRHDYDAALVEYHDLASRLPLWGYSCHHLPKAPVQDRVKFVMALMMNEPAK
ncbi:MAG: AAA family ATPase [Pseudomonadota bacterium]